MHADRTNRIALVLFGLLVLLAGAAGLAASLGVFGTGLSRHALLDNQVSMYVGRNGGWLWPAAAALGLLIALAALRWIATLLLSTDRADEITISRGSRQGTTIMHPAALSGALSREIEGYRGVDAAKARVLGEASDPELVVTVTATRSTDLGQLRRRLESEALSHARQALDQPRLPIQLDIDVSSRESERVS